jgi:hypothetical protein
VTAQRVLMAVVCFGLVSCKTTRLEESEVSGAPPATGTNDVVELNSSVTLTGIWDFEIKKGTSRCVDMVDKVTSSPYFNGMINFIPTFYYRVAHNGPKVAVPEVQSSLDPEKELTLVHARDFCVLRDAQKCEPLTKEVVETFQEGMTQCFARAVEKGAGISVVPHLDDGERLGHWRNTVVFDPFPSGDPECKNDYSSYYCGFLRPLALALKVARRSNTPTYMATQGEMGATVFTHPGKHGQLIRLLRHTIARVDGTVDPSGGSVRTGVNLNFNVIFGLVPPEKISQDGVRYLLSESTFLGISAYPIIVRQEGDVKSWQFDKAFEIFNKELSEIDLNLRDFGNLELHFSEVGLGGSHDGKSPAKTGESALSSPWYGVHGPYDKGSDPWVTADLRKARYDFYCGLIHYLAKAKTRSWPVKRAFLWSLTSWDVQGIYPASTNDQGSYADPTISQMIASYNREGTSQCEKNSPPAVSENLADQ